MQIELDPLLLEEVVFLAVRRREQLGDQAMFQQYHNRIDALYDLPAEGQGREIAFRDANAEFFSRLGLEQLVRDRLGEFPLLGRELDRITFWKAVSRKQEGAELFVRKGNRAGGPPPRVVVVRLRAEAFLDPDQLSMLLRRELYHVCDMVDPTFGYRPDLGETGESIAQQNLVRDRYRVVWSVYIDARLVRTGRAPPSVLKLRQSQLEKVFDGFGRRGTRAIFQTVSDAESLTHADLLALAKSCVANLAAGSVGAPGENVSPAASANK